MNELVAHARRILDGQQTNEVPLPSYRILMATEGGWHLVEREQTKELVWLWEELL